MGPDKKPPTEEEKRKHEDEAVEEADEESFPASDPPSWTLGVEPSVDKTQP